MQLLGRRQAIKIEVGDVEARRLVALHQRERRAWDFEALLRAQGFDEGAREGGLAGAQIAFEGQHVAGLQGEGEILGEAAERGFGEVWNFV